MNIFYSGKPVKHLLIAVKNLLLTIISLGIYRFWAKTNLRSYIWSHLEIANAPLNYHGTPKELLRAFLKALPFFLLFIFFGVLLGWISIYLEQAVTSVFVIWVVCYANYSKQQYIYSRTSWKGIRFSLKGSRIKYANLCFRIFLKSLLTFGRSNHRYFIQINSYVFENVSWGQMSLTFTGKVEDLKKINNKIRLVFLILSMICLVLCIIGAALRISLFMGLLSLSGLLLIALVGYFVLYVVYEIIFSFFSTRYALNNLAFQDVKLKVNYTFMQCLRFHICNFILLVISLGLASPYIIPFSKNFR